MTYSFAVFPSLTNKQFHCKFIVIVVANIYILFLHLVRSGIAISFMGFRFGLTYVFFLLLDCVHAFCIFVCNVVDVRPFIGR